MYAAMHDAADAVTMLVRAGSDVNAYGRTSALLLTRDVNIARTLIDVGANVNVTAYDDFVTPLICECHVSSRANPEPKRIAYCSRKNLFLCGPATWIKLPK